MNKKKLMAGILAFSMMIVAAGCGKTDEVPEAPAETPVEAPAETPVETPAETPVEAPVEEERVYEGKFWDTMSSMSQTELEASEDVYFLNSELDHVDGKLEVTVSKMYFVEDGLFIELNLDNGTETPRTNIILKEFTLNEIVDIDEATDEGTEVVLIDKVEVGAFNNVVIKPGEAKLITFVVPYDSLQNEVYNFDRVNYNWSFEVSETDVFNLKSTNAEADADTPVDVPVETPEG